MAGRPKKNAAEEALNQESEKLFNEQQNIATSAAQDENNNLQQEDVSPIEIAGYVEAVKCTDDKNCYLISFANDVELYDGRMMLRSGIYIKDGWSGLILPTQDNAYNGLKAEENMRLINSDVICMGVSKNVKIVLNIKDDVFTIEHTEFASRPRRIKILAHTPIAKLMLFKQL